jgi:hypothetical protein
MSAVKLLWDEETQSWLTPKQIKLKDVRKRLEKVDKTKLTLADMYDALYLLIELIGED